MNDKTLGEYKRTTPDPDETTGEALARLQAELTRLLDEADAELRAQARCPDPDEHVRYDAALAAAEKAEQERDDARSALSAAELKAAAAPAIAHTMNAARALAPGDIRQLVRRNRFRVADAIRALYPEESASTWEIERVVTAALTEPPKRPEGAERWEDFLIDSLDYQALTDQQIADLADRIAEEMNR